MKRMKLALIHNNKNSPWIEIDKEIYSFQYEVQEIFIPGPKDALTQLRNLLTSDILVFWFGSLLFFPLIFINRFFNKKILIVAGGYDVSKLPELRYGAFCEGKLSQFIRRTLFYLADRIVGVSESNLNEIKESLLYKKMPTFQYLGFKKISLPLKNFNQRHNQVVMISNVTDDLTFKLKGMDIFIKVARQLPEIEFVHIGHLHDKFKSDLPENLILKGVLKNHSNEFQDILNSSKIIFQHSKIESFCAAIVDGAMLGCLPIVSDRFSLPEIVGKDGIVVPYNDLEMLCRKVEQYIKTSFLEPEIISSRFHEKYSFEKRKEKLLKIINEL